jgi:hypothetical protein
MKDLWAALRDRIALRYPLLSPEDLRYLEGQEEDFVCRVEQKTGKNIHELIAGTRKR